MQTGPAGEVQLAEFHVPALGLQTYIWNNNIRSALLLIGFPVLLLGMVFCLTLGMIWAGMLPPGDEYGGDLLPRPCRLMVERRVRWPSPWPVVWFVIAYFLQPGHHRLRHRLAAADPRGGACAPTTSWKTSASRVG